MFKQAPALPKKPRANKVPVRRVPLTGVQDLAAIDKIIEHLNALRETIEKDVKSAATIEFIRIGRAAKNRPDNFVAEEGIGEASCQLKLRSPTSALTALEAKSLIDLGIQVAEEEKVADTYVVNPIYMKDQALLDKIGKKLNRYKDVPEDFIMKQQGSKKFIASEAGLNDLFKISKTSTIEKFLPLITSLALKPKLTTDDVDQAYTIVDALLKKASAPKV